MKRIFYTGLIIGLFAHSTFAQNIPNDPLYRSQWAPAKIGLPAVWTEFTKGGVTADGDTIVVAVIDGGCNLNYEDLKSNFWKNRREIPNNGNDDDNNGYIDDYNGWNAKNSANMTSSGIYDHGTTVAEIIGAIGNNGIGICGVNWKVKILPVLGVDPDVEVTRRAVGYVVKMRRMYNETGGQKGAFIVAANFSFGPSLNANADVLSKWFQMFDDLGRVGILSCQATGNEGWNLDTKISLPVGCSREHHIFVTNTTADDTKVSNANYGVNLVDIGAPGSNIYKDGSGVVRESNSYTSWAAPHVASVIALMYAAMPQWMIRNCKSDPGGFAGLVKQKLLDGADYIPALNPYVASGRRLNAYKAVASVAYRITGPESIGNSRTGQYSLTGQMGNIYWTTGNSGLFSVVSSGNPTTVTRAGSGTGVDTLYAHTGSVSGPVVAKKAIIAYVSSISGNNEVCYSGSSFTLSNAPPTLTWTVSNSNTFTIANPNANPVTVVRKGSGTGSVTLYARSGNASAPAIASKTITPCASPIIGPDMVDYGGSVFTLNLASSGGLGIGLSGPFYAYVAPNNPAAVAIYRYGTENTSGMLTVNENSKVIGQKNILPCPPVYITGPDVVCPSSTFTFPAPVGATWQASSNLWISSSGNSINVSKKTNGLGWVSVHHKGYELARKYFWVGTAEIESISGPAQIPSSGSGEFSVVEGQSRFFSNAASYQWRLVGVGYGMVDERFMTSSAPVRFFFYTPGAYKVYCRIANECGYSEFFDYDVVYYGNRSLSLHTAYPNPVSGILTVEIGADAAVSSRSHTVTSYDVRLYDGQGNLKRQQKVKGGKIEFNVRNLPVGVYYLHIYDGVSDIPEFHQIVVER